MKQNGRLAAYRHKCRDAALPRALLHFLSQHGMQNFRKAAARFVCCAVAPYLPPAVNLYIMRLPLLPARAYTVCACITSACIAAYIMHI